MKINLKINENLDEISVNIEAPKMNSEIAKIIEIFEKSNTGTQLINGKSEDKFFFLDPTDIDIIRTEGGKLVMYDRLGKIYTVSKTLQEIFAGLPHQFFRISKSAVVNIKRIDHISNSFSGTMYIKMKNGTDDYISRKYFTEFKTRLGL